MSLFEKAVRLEDNGFRQMALPLFIGATRESPADPDVWVRAGKAALKLDRPEVAAHLLEECLRIHPNNLRATRRLLVSRLRQGHFAAAADLCRRVLELDATNVQALVTLGYIAPVLGKPEQARAFFDQAFALEQKHGTRRADTFEARLLCGDYEAGWGCMHPESSMRKPARWVKHTEPYWRGEIAEDRTVCVHSLGGLGDVLMFVRYVPLIAERVGRVVITAPACLDPVLTSVEGLSGVVRHWSEVGDALYINGLQLPSIFRTTLDTVPTSFPYVRGPCSGPELPPRSQLRVGLVWAGNPRLWTDPDRSVPAPQLLTPLVSVPGVQWVSLQVGARQEWADTLSIPLRPVLGDFGDTAYVLDQLDLVITVDTAVANLALAMAVPTWVLPPTYLDYRWGNWNQPSPWYPAARLFRRAHTAEWEGVIGRVAEALHAEVAQHSPARTEPGFARAGTAE
jgi:hypothetical protein